MGITNTVSFNTVLMSCEFYNQKIKYRLFNSLFPVYFEPSSSFFINQVFFENLKSKIRHI